MKRAGFAGIAVIAALGLNAACGPQGGKQVPIKKSSRPTGDASSLEKTTGIGSACVSKLSGKTERISIDEGVQICAWAGPDDLSAEDKAAAAKNEFALGQNYEVKTIPLVGSVSAQAASSAKAEAASQTSGSPSATKSTSAMRKISVDIKVLLGLPDGVTEAQAKQIQEYVQNACFDKKIRPMWTRDRAALDYKIQFLTDVDPLSEVHRELDLVVSPEAVEDAGKRPQLALRDWPFHSMLAPLGSPACDAKCGRLDGAAARRNCQTACVERASEPFCQSLGKLTVHWLGMADPMAEKGCVLNEGEEHPAIKEKLLIVGYRKTTDKTTDKTTEAKEGQADGDERKTTEDPNDRSVDTKANAQKAFDWTKLNINASLGNFVGSVCAEGKN